MSKTNENVNVQQEIDENELNELDSKHNFEDDSEDEIEEDDDDEDDQDDLRERLLNKRTPSALRRTSKKKLISKKVTDIFDFTKDYVKKTNHPVRIIIKRGGAYLSETRVSGRPDQTTLKSYADVQKIFGGGLYSFDVYDEHTCSIVKNEIIEIEQYIAPQPIQPNFFSNTSGFVQDANYFDNNRQNYNSRNNNDENERTIHVNPSFNMPPLPPTVQKSPVSEMKEMMGLFVGMFQMLNQNKDTGPSKYELEEKFDRKLREERDRWQAEQDRIEKIVAQRVAEKAQSLGIEPEKSIVSQIIEGLGHVKDMYSDRVKLVKEKPIEVVTKRPTVGHQEVQHTEQEPLTTPKVLTLEEKKTLMCERIVNALIFEWKSGLTADQIAEKIKNSPNLKNSIGIIGKEKISEKLRSVLNLDDTTFLAVKENIDKIFNSIFTDQQNFPNTEETITNGDNL